MRSGRIVLVTVGIRCELGRTSEVRHTWTLFCETVKTSERKKEFLLAWLHLEDAVCAAGGTLQCAKSGAWP